MRVLVLGGGTLLSSLDVVLPDMTWSTYSHVFTADTATTTLKFELEKAGFDPTSGAFIDNVNFAAVPEPSSLILAGCAAFSWIVCCPWCAKKRRSSSR